MPKNRMTAALVSCLFQAACAPGEPGDDASGTSASGAEDGGEGTSGSSSTAGGGTATSASTGTGTSTGASTTTSSGGTTGDTEGGFVEPADVGSGGIAQCDVYAQDCADGEKCLPYASDGGGVPNATRCSPIAPNPGAPGDDCMPTGSVFGGEDNCGAGMMCWDVAADTNTGYCISLCQGSAAAPTCADSSTVCGAFNDGMLPLCVLTCDPLVFDCEHGDVCVASGIVGSPFVCIFPADRAMPTPYGEACALGNQCAAGLTCQPAETVPDCTGSACCTNWCDLDASDPEAACGGVADGQQCVPAFGDMAAPPGYENVGVCALPA